MVDWNEKSDCNSELDNYTYYGSHLLIFIKTTFLKKTIQ